MNIKNQNSQATEPIETHTDIATQLIIENLKVSYGPIQAVKGISFNIKKSQITCLIGSNGAGKTSTLKALCGLLPHSGTITLSIGSHVGSAPQDRTVLDSQIEGPSKTFTNKKINLSHLSTQQRLQHKIALSPEGRGVFPNLTVLENLLLGAYLQKSKSEIKNLLDQQFSIFKRLYERKHQLAGTLSGGEQQMLSISRALMSSPEFLLLDEPSLGLAPVIIEQIFNKFTELKNQGIGLLLVEQNAHLALEISDTAYVLETGQILFSGKGNELLNDPRVIKAYLN